MSEEQPIGNPYNHQDPVSNPEFFINREEILEDIRYNLKQATFRRPQYKNIGITGDEGSGKSSLGNMTKEIADELDMVSAHLRLNEQIVNNEVELFKEVIGEITSQLGGDPREGFLNYLSGITDQVEFDLKFLRVYFSGQDSNSDRGPISENILREDLEKLYESCEQPSIVIILDNAQYLSKNNILLQRLKNIFSDINGYNLVLVGTNDTFSDISDAFSPVARMFDKFEIGPFDSIEYTKECVYRPLPESTKEKISSQTISDIHRITGGRPYEINLVCDYMYREYEEDSGPDSLTLSPEVIDRVVDQMETWRRSVDNKIPEKVRELSEEKLQIVINSIECPNVPKNWLSKYSLLKRIEDIPKDPISSQIDNDKERIDELIDEGILTAASDGIEFAGGLYSLAFVKYHSYSKGVTDKLGGAALATEGATIANIHYYIVDQGLLDGIEEAHSHFSPDSQAAQQVVHSIFTDPVEFEDENISSNKGILSDTTVMKYDYHNTYSNSRISSNHNKSYSPEETMYFRCDIPWIGSGFRFYIHLDDKSLKEEINERFSLLKRQMSEINIEVFNHSEQSLYHEGFRLLKNEELDEAKEKAERAIEINENYPKAWYLLSLVQAAQEQYEEGVKSINQALDMNENWTDAYIVRGELQLELEDIEAALSSFEQAIELDSSPDVWAKICHELMLQEEYDLGYKYGKECLDEQTGNAHLELHLTQGEIAREEYEQAMKRVNRVLNEATYPDIDDYREALIGQKAICKREVGEVDKSIELFRSIKSPDNALSSAHLAVSLAMKRDGVDDEIRELVRNAVENNDDSLDIFEEYDVISASSII